MGDVTRVLCRVEHRPCDLRVVDTLARLHVTARRAGATFAVHHPSPELRSLLLLLGLEQLLGPDEPGG